MYKSRCCEPVEYTFCCKKRWGDCNDVDSTKENERKYIFNVILMASPDPLNPFVGKVYFSLFLSSNILRVRKYLDGNVAYKQNFSRNYQNKNKIYLFSIDIECACVLTICLKRCLAVSKAMIRVFAIRIAILMAYTLNTFSSTLICIFLSFNEIFLEIKVDDTQFSNPILKIYTCLLLSRL